MASNSTVRPKLADVYFDWGAEEAATPSPSTGGTVAVAASGSWGPVNQAVLLTSEDGGDQYSYLNVFGPGDTPLRRAVHGAFKGQGVNGQGGAGAVIAVRQAASTAAKGSVTLKNSAGSPADALTLTAKQPGTYVNDMRVTVQAGASTGTDELLILDGGLVVEQFTYNQADLASLAAQISELSSWFDPEVLVDGTALALVSSAPVAGGDDGETLTGTEWAGTFDVLDRERWQYFGPYGVTDEAIRASIVAWIQERNTNGARCMTAFGGALGEPLADALARTLAINDYNIINLGEGTLHLTDENRDVSTAEFVTRYLGARAWRGESRGDIYVRFADVDLIAGASLTEQQQALDGGVVVFSRDTDPNAPVFIREAKNTYVDDSASPVDANGVKMHPQNLYSVIKNIAIQQGIELEVGEWARSGTVLGDMPVNDKTREQILGRVTIAYSNREKAQVVQPGWTVASASGQSDDDDFVQYIHGFHPTRSLRQILNVARIG